MTCSMHLLTRYCKLGTVAHSNAHASTWYADSHVFDDHVQQHSCIEIGHRILSMAVLSLPLIPLLMKGTG